MIFSSILYLICLGNTHLIRSDFATIFTECVEGVCSCYYKNRLPGITAATVISGNRLTVSWFLQYENASAADLPDDVELQHVDIT